MAFRVLIIGGTGQVGAAVVRALVAEPSCAEVVMVNRKTTPLTADNRLRQVILDTAATQFQAEVTKLAMRVMPTSAPCSPPRRKPKPPPIGSMPARPSCP
jgi:nucleoside-diphosphate-sugar epimerase